MNGWDGVRAWRFIRASKGYRTAWKRRVPQPGLPERAPFPVRLQTAADLAALEWGMSAWENPYAEDGPLMPFWALATTADGMVAPGAAPLSALAAAGDATLSGLRLGDATLSGLRLGDGALISGSSGRARRSRSASPAARGFPRMAGSCWCAR